MKKFSGTAIMTHFKPATVEKIPARGVIGEELIDGFANPPEIHLTITNIDTTLTIAEMNSLLHSLFNQRGVKITIE